VFCVFCPTTASSTGEVYGQGPGKWVRKWQRDDCSLLSAVARL